MLMAYRFTNTDKWSDAWFSELKQIEMLLFLYLCDNCDIAGFIEINYKRWASDLSSSKETIEGALKGLERGLIVSNSNDCILVKNFIKHQKNTPLNLENKAHLGIYKRFELYANKFDFELSLNGINELIKGASKGLVSPSGIGNELSNEIVIKENFEKFWNLYDKKTSYKKCFAKWKTIQKKNYDIIFKHVEKYVKSKPEKQYRKDPETYLNQEFWESEIISKNLFSTNSSAPPKIETDEFLKLFNKPKQ